MQHCADHHRPDQTGTASPDLNIRGKTLSRVNSYSETDDLCLFPIDGSIQAENPLKLEADVNSSSTPNTKLHLTHEGGFYF